MLLCTAVYADNVYFLVWHLAMATYKFRLMCFIDDAVKLVVLAFNNTNSNKT